MAQPIVLLMLFTVVQLIPFISSETLYIRPDLDTSDCPMNEQCLTLSEVAGNSSVFSSQDSLTLMFLSGHHILSEPLSIRNITTLELLSNSSSLAGTVTITCSNTTTNLIFEYVGQFQIRGLSFIGCGNRVVKVKQFTLENSLFDGQNVSGTALDLESVSEARISGCSFMSNVKDTSNRESLLLFLQALNSGCVKFGILLEHIGGALTIIYSNATIEGTQFDHNIARIGGAMYSASSNVTITSCNFNNNAATDYFDDDIINLTDEESTGGAIHAVGSHVIINESSFTNNTAVGLGGAIHNDGDLTITNGSSFTGNKAHIDGGALYIHHGTVVIETNNDFTLNLAHRDGGAINNHELLTIRNSNTFERNTATGDGGAVSNSGTLTVTDSNHFIGSTTNGDGGAVFNSGVLNITDSNIFEANIAQRNGGGVYIADNDVSITDNNQFINNVAMIDGGGLWTQFGNIAIENNVSFINNTAYGDGGALWVKDAVLNIRNGNLFHRNNATVDGGVLWIQHSSLTITTRNVFRANVALNDGGVAFIQYTNMTVSDNNVFDSNIAYDDGGAVNARDDVRLEFLNGNSFTNNSAVEAGGALLLRAVHVLFSDTEFINNTVDEEGGAMRVYGRSSVTFSRHNIFSNNKAIDGALILIRDSHLTSETDAIINMTENTAECAGVVYTSGSMLDLYGHTDVSDNIGSLFVDSNSIVNFFGNSSFTNSLSDISTHCSQAEGSGQGGSITLTNGGEVNFYGNTNFENNEAVQGGAILARANSLIRIQGKVNIVRNVAGSDGAGISLFGSRLIVGDYIRFDGNTADQLGGGIYSFESNITIENGSVQLSNNHAKYGGGVYFDQNSRLMINKMSTESYEIEEELRFTGNSATQFGGAVFVNDYKNKAVCTSSAQMNPSSETECFFQILDYSNGSRPSFYFSANSAQRGAVLYGGLLDRCTLNGEGPLNNHPIDYLRKVSNLQESDIKTQISSAAVRVCFCQDEIPDCTYQLPPVTVELDGTFSVPVAAVDQVNNSLSTIVYSSHISLEDGRVQALLSQNTSQSCTLLDFTSPHSSKIHILYADGPCSDMGISQQMIELEFETCEDHCSRFVGFQPSPLNLTTCQCKCRTDLPHITSCLSNSGELVRDGDYWIDVIPHDNTTDATHAGYSFISLRYCPYDYCLPSHSHILLKLSLENESGSDAQCASNRSGKACGSCKEGLSLVFGSSRCKKCSNKYLALLIPFAIAGITIVVFLMVCNLTVAVGTMNGVIFFANVVVANRTILFPYGVTSVLTLFISWLSLSVGVETCFYDGMDGFAKVLLQFLFDFYLIIIVIVILVACHYSIRISNLLANKNPVATLATLILYAFEKSTRKLFSILSFAVVSYSSGRTEVVWLFDPGERYLHGRHIVLFVLFFLISIFGCVFIFLLIFGHCLSRLPDRKLFKFLHHPKFLSLLDAYQAPYKPHHRYWVGILLLVRVILYLFLEFNAAGDIRVSLVVVITIGICVLTFKLFVGGVYKSRWKDSLETFFIFDLTMFTVITFYSRDVGLNQSIIAHIWFGIVFVTVLGIMVYHTYKYVLKGTSVRDRIDKFLKRLKGTVVTLCPCLAREDKEELYIRNYRNYDTSMRSYANTLQRPLNLLDRIPSDIDYRLAEGPDMSVQAVGSMTNAVVEITRDSLPFSTVLGHDQRNILVDPNSPASCEDSETDESTMTTQTTLSTTLSSKDTF